jgi:mannose-6-phosphate isomerase-like protein (cupin superfamily)
VSALYFRFVVGLMGFVLIGIPFGLCVDDASADEPAIAHSVDSSGLEWGACPDFFPDGCEIAVLHGDPAKPNVDIFFRVPGNYELPLHRHTSAERMVLVSGELQITYEGQPMASLGDGEYAYGPAQRAHSGRCVSEEPCVLFIAFEAPLDTIEIASEAEE